jgi:predicted TIM-barrel fold metal-dependent hydrolase
VRDGLFICDAQVHAPRVDPVGRVNGMDEGPLMNEMQAAGVDRAIIVPLATKTNPADNDPAVGIAMRHLDTFRVMGLLDIEHELGATGLLQSWGNNPGMLGIRVSCFREPFRSMFLNNALDWLWNAADQNNVPIMLNAPEMTEEIGEIATRHPGLRIIVDHLGLRPHTVYEDLLEPVRPLLSLAHHSNIAVKATCIPSTVPGPYPFRASHEAMRNVVAIFGAERVFWGSDLTRLPCSYAESVTMFTDELAFLSPREKKLLMGRAICEWLNWPFG